MNRPAPGALERRVLLRTTTSKDAELAIGVLGRNGMDAEQCASGAELAR